MADFRSLLYSIDEGGAGSISWQPLQQITSAVAKVHCLPGDLLAALTDRLKSEATYVVLNTLTALHTLCLNSKQPVHDQLVSSKVMKYLERLLNKPPFPGVEVAAAQLLMDWAFLYGQEELGHRSFAVLTSTSKHRAMLQSMAASDVAVMLKEDQKLGLPQFCSTVRGLDFHRHFATQLAGPLTGTSTPPGVASQLAKAAVAASYSDDAAAAAAAAASRNTFAAWAERVAQDPQAAAQRVVNSQSNIEADLNALEAAQEACVAAARECAKQQPLNNSSNTKAAAAAVPGMVQLRHQLDKAYLAACKANEWREMTEVLVQQRLPDTQLSALLSLADKINTVLDGWQQAATTEVFWLLGINTAGLADGSILPSVIAAATAAAGTGASADPSSAAAAAAAVGGGAGPAADAPGPSKLQQQQQNASSLRRGSSSYLDLLTGDTPAALSTTNPFLSSNSMGRVPVQANSGPAAAAAAAPTDELQQYLQELGVAATNGVGSGTFHQQQQHRPAPAPPQQQQQQQHRPAPPPPQQQQQQQFKHYPSIGQPVQQQQQSTNRLAQQQQQHTVGWLGTQVSTHHPPNAPYLQHQHQPLLAIHSMDGTSSSSSSSSTSHSAALARHASAPSAAAAAGSRSTGSAAAAAAVMAAANAASAAAAAAGDTGSSSDSAAAVTSYTNPFAALDTRTIMKGLKGPGSGPVPHSGSAAAAGSSGAHAVFADTRGSARSSMDGGSSSNAFDRVGHAQLQQQQQQQQHGLQVQPVQDLSASVQDLSSPLVMMPLSPSVPPQQQQQHGQLAVMQAKVQQLFQRLSGGGVQQPGCGSCGLPSRPNLEPAVLQLLLEQQQQHELQVQQLQQQHQQQVAEIKAMAVHRFKELQQQLAARQQAPQETEIQYGTR